MRLDDEVLERRVILEKNSMWSVDDLNHLDDTLSVQMRLALASPLWKFLPYGVQINPRTWQVDILDMQPHRRVCLHITVPWRPARPEHAPLEFIMLIWHNRRARCLHHKLTELNERRGQQPGRRMIFYDVLSHAFVSQYQRPGKSVPGEEAPFRFNTRWARRMMKIILKLIED